MVWAIDFQFDSTADGIRFDIASMVDEHTRELLLDITARSINGEDLVTGIEAVIARRSVPVLIRSNSPPANEIMSSIVSGTGAPARS